MSFGECTITLQDVALHLGLKIDGELVNEATSYKWYAVVQHLLRVAPPVNVIKWGLLRMNRLNSNFNNVEALAHLARAYIMCKIGGCLLGDHTDCHITLRYLPHLEELEESGTYSWGSIVLANLYWKMCKAINCTRIEIGGCVQVIDPILGLG